ncbi:WXG100 family type VII secretion target [Actinocrispum wychmicini]|uniref:Type VII secretion system (Wss) protein ESAT-6 n=1 Tax=Actinocrispum wychmicini TaxID=1213861 RepID=A0A4R2J6C3_9PSEU|nr:WXG100 family type VII secretion target [Actinocrispum wychmicini]TCO50715.1 hypothetical protein EV192_11393 [Actinocrispum wychmicini]
MDFQSFVESQFADDPMPSGQPIREPGDHLDELGAKVQLTGVTGERTSTPILDGGRPGLDFFAAFGPAYAKFTGVPHDYQQHVVRRYQEQGELNFARLRADAERYAEIQTRVADALTGVRNSGSAVFEAWRGDAAGSANAHFDDFLQRGKQTLDQFVRLAATITVAVDTADRICFEQASAVKSLCADRIGPCAKADVDFLVDFGRRCASGNFTDEELKRVADLCDVDILPALCRATPQIFEKVAEDVNGWLAEVFVPFYEARLAKFDAACSAAKDTITTAWNGLGNALSQVRADHFTAPAQTTTAPAQAATVIAADATAVTTGKPDRPDDDSTGQAELMSPASTGVAIPMPPPAPIVAAPTAATGAAGYGGYGFFGGVPFAGAQGGGDKERTRSLPLAGEEVFAEGESRADDNSLVIGGEHDTSVYNEEDDAVAERDVDPIAFGDEEDIW